MRSKAPSRGLYGSYGIRELALGIPRTTPRPRGGELWPELVLCVLALLLQVTLHSIPIGSGDKTGSLGLGFLSIKYRIVKDLQNYRVVNPQYCCGLW